MTTLEVLHVLFCLVLAWTCFMRVAQMGGNTRPSVRLGFVYGVSTSLLLAAAPWLNSVWPWFPKFDAHPAVIGVLVAVDGFQIATAHYWVRGTPSCFTKPGSAS